MQVSDDFICEHEMPKPWATCTECMLLPQNDRPIPKFETKPVAPARVSRSAAGPKTKSKTVRGAGRTAPSTSPRVSNRLPRRADDQAPELVGMHDLSYEIPDDNVFFHTRPPDHDWLAISAFPVRLRANGWVYLQVDRHVVARCQVTGIGFRERRWTQEPSDVSRDLGSGPTLELRPSTWERLRVDLGVQGDANTDDYRYLMTGPDGSVTVAADDEESATLT